MDKTYVTSYASNFITKNHQKMHLNATIKKREAWMENCLVCTSFFCACEYKFLFTQHFSCFIYSCFVLGWFALAILLLSWGMSYSSVRYQWVQLVWTSCIAWLIPPITILYCVSSHLDWFVFVCIRVLLCSEVTIFKCYFCTKVLEPAGNICGFKAHTLNALELTKSCLSASSHPEVLALILLWEWSTSSSVLDKVIRMWRYWMSSAGQIRQLTVSVPERPQKKP